MVESQASLIVPLHESHGNGLEYQLPLFRVVDDYIATGILDTGIPGR